MRIRRHLCCIVLYSAVLGLDTVDSILRGSICEHDYVRRGATNQVIVSVQTDGKDAQQLCYGYAPDIKDAHQLGYYC